MTLDRTTRFLAFSLFVGGCALAVIMALSLKSF